ncbi:hypothetical protein AGMMS50233_11250 [Endomicrobiia bacterium]|nr:hypothetical protein AGMMS50233_11250 [Endomicrobiia bacterium]
MGVGGGGEEVNALVLVSDVEGELLGGFDVIAGGVLGDDLGGFDSAKSFG